MCVNNKFAFIEFDYFAAFTNNLELIRPVIFCLLRFKAAKQFLSFSRLHLALRDTRAHKGTRDVKDHDLSVHRTSNELHLVP